AAMAELTDVQWQTRVLSSRGVPIPATQIPWMRSCEVLIHAVDLDTGVTFADLPDDFLTRLCEDIRTDRGNVPPVTGPLPEQAAYLSGRPYTAVHTPSGEAAKPLPPWR
ncbi:MAG TPA: maleylpyruvate isomerase, partial [Kribbella sp.]|nr:maleylpyruvate isomerase [Kribbella sp.]